MRATKMNEKFIDAISQLASEIEAADSTKKVDVAKAMNLIGDVMPRTLIGITYDLCRWMSWWRSEGRDAGHDLLGSVQPFFLSLRQLNRKPATIMRFCFSIKRILTVLEVHLPDDAFSAIPPTVRAAPELKKWRPLAGSPFGWEKIQKCVAVADSENRQDVRFIASILVLYDAMAYADEIFGHRQHQEWHREPASRFDVRYLPDGSGLLALRPSGGRSHGRDAYLSHLTMEWLERSFRTRVEKGGPLFLSSRGNPMDSKGWERGIRKIACRAGFDPMTLSVSSPRFGMAKDLLAQGASIDDVCRIGGWTDKSRVVRLMDDSPKPYTLHELIREQGRERRHA